MGNDVLSPTALTKRFYNDVCAENSTVVAVIAGHVHMDHVDRLSNNNDVMQYCLGASYEGYARVFNIHG